MRYEDYRAAQEFIENKSLRLMKHENKDFAKVSFPIQNYRVYPIKGRTFYCAMTNVFKEIIRSVLIEAVQTHSTKFGTGHGMDVIEAIYKVEPLFFDLPRFAEFLRSEQFCYVMENKCGIIHDKVLRIDLFRKFNETKAGSLEFTGGIFHALKHFSMGGINLSTGRDVNDIVHPEAVIGLAIRAFFFEDEEFVNPNEFRARVGIDDNYNLRFAFYYEKNTEVYFLKTIFKEPKKQ